MRMLSAGKRSCLAIEGRCRPIRASDEERTRIRVPTQVYVVANPRSHDTDFARLGLLTLLAEHENVPAIATCSQAA